MKEIPHPNDQCSYMSTDLATGRRKQCDKQGFHCWVHGEFGRSARVLCLQHVNAVKKMGWRVSYQIEGDNPPSLEQELENG